MNSRRSARYISDVDSDSQLLRQVGDGDERALEHLYERYAPAVIGFVNRRVSDRGLAEEICADVWLGCWRSASSFRGESKVLTWLLGISTRQIHVHTRGKRLNTVPLDTDFEIDAGDSDDPARIVSDASGLSLVTEALRALPADLYEIVSLAWLHEMPYDEIAATVGIPPGTVKSRVWRARQILRSRLGVFDA